jgi:Fe-S-cluster-containing dehydrogenase component
VVNLGSFPDETGQMAHLVMPTHTFLESWGDHSPVAGVRGLMQPVTGPVFNTRPLADILLSLGRGLAGNEAFPEKDAYEVLRRYIGSGGRASGGENTDAAWQAALMRGGLWGREERPLSPSKRPPLKGLTFPPSPAPPRGETRLSFISYPTIQFFDGRMANRPVLQELPDPMTAVTWDGWVEIHPETAKRLKIERGDILEISSGPVAIRAPAYPFPGVGRDTLAMPIGHGHRAFGRYAGSRTGNPLALASGRLDGAGGIVRSLEVTLRKTGKSMTLAHTDGSQDQHGRGIARSISWSEYSASPPGPPEVVLPLAEGFTRERDFYPPHRHDDYRWCMAVDLDRCVGCGACVAACYTENNVAVVGREQVIKGREMAWLHVQRYFEEKEPFARFIPMLCQHCDEAPCEPVCPVFAPNHSKEGINNQVYNRCIGTRFCSQNCPYKVRRFNWFTWTHDSPLELQLNPDVTVRMKGVMEKCSFCIQRINGARIKARSEARLIRDGEFAPACVETCPTDALVFGNLKDPASRVRQRVGEARAYQVLGELNTKPGVIYLKRITQRII